MSLLGGSTDPQSPTSDEEASRNVASYDGSTTGGEQQTNGRQSAASYYISLEDELEGNDGQSTSDDYHSVMEREFVEKSKPWFKKERSYVERSKPVLQKFFGFTPPESEALENQVIRPTALGTIALPLLFFCLGLFSLRNQQKYSEWAKIIPQVTCPIWALLTDCKPILGLRRKPYLWIGFVTIMVMNFLLLFAGNWFWTAFPFVFIQESARLLLLIVGNAMVVERTWLQEHGGGFTLLWICQAFYHLGRFILNAPQVIFNGLWPYDVFHHGPVPQFFIGILIPAVIFLPFLPHLKDAQSRSVPSEGADSSVVAVPDTLMGRARKVGSDIWVILQTKLTLLILAFVILYVMCSTCIQVMNIFDGLMDWFIVDQWAFALTSCIFVAFYGMFMMKLDWRKIFPACSIFILAVVGLGYTGNVMLRAGNALVAGAMAVSEVPRLVIYVGLCPPGSEASMFLVLEAIRHVVAKEMGVSLFFANTFHNYYWVSYLYIFVPLILFLKFIPSNRFHQKELQQEDFATYPWLLGVLIGVVVVFNLFMMWFWAKGYTSMTSEADDEEYYNSDQFWYDWGTFQSIF